MPRFVVVVETINARPINYPSNEFTRLWDRLEKYLTYDAGQLLQQDMFDTTKKWRKAPKMVKKISKPYGTRLQLDVYPSGRGATNWRRISEGTGPRFIRARTPRGMAFQTGYSPKTTPGGNYSGSGMRYGPWRRGVMVVSKHRIEPRKFAVHIMHKRENKIRRDIQKIVKRVGT